MTFFDDFIKYGSSLFQFIFALVNNLKCLSQLAVFRAIAWLFLLDLFDLVNIDSWLVYQLVNFLSLSLFKSFCHYEEVEVHTEVFRYEKKQELCGNKGIE
jgi:hypothetical protein